MKSRTHPPEHPDHGDNRDVRSCHRVRDRVHATCLLMLSPGAIISDFFWSRVVDPELSFGQSRLKWKPTAQFIRQSLESHMPSTPGSGNHLPTICNTPRERPSVRQQTTRRICFQSSRPLVAAVEEHPTRTLLIAGGLGLAVGALWKTIGISTQLVRAPIGRDCRGSM